VGQEPLAAGPSGLAGEGRLAYSPDFRAIWHGSEPRAELSRPFGEWNAGRRIIGGKPVREIIEVTPYDIRERVKVLAETGNVTRPGEALLADDAFTEALFGRATFTEPVNFAGATFTKWADFRGATFTKPANFAGVTFTDGANFEGATFKERADFAGATFTKATDFEGATFNERANFARATFAEEARFHSATLTKANFARATFTKAANFLGATFNEEANFIYAEMKAKRSLARQCSALSRQGFLAPSSARGQHGMP
jgi:hypothetical protein